MNDGGSYRGGQILLKICKIGLEWLRKIRANINKKKYNFKHFWGSDGWKCSGVHEFQKMRKKKSRVLRNFGKIGLKKQQRILNIIKGLRRYMGEHKSQKMWKSSRL